jgi:hypothetical protein
MWFKELESKYQGVPTWMLENELRKHARKVIVIPLVVFIIASISGCRIAMEFLNIQEHTLLMNVIILGLIGFLSGCFFGIITSAVLERPSVAAWIDELTGEWERRTVIMPQCRYGNCDRCSVSNSTQVDHYTDV